MNQAGDQIVLIRPKEIVAKELTDLIERGEILRKDLLKNPPKSDDDLMRLVKQSNGRFHVWIRSIEQEFARSFSPAAKLKEWLRNQEHIQWKYHISWEDRAAALPKDISTHLNFLEVILDRVIDIYEEALPTRQTQSVIIERQLKENMIEGFSKDELRSLTADLDIRFESLGSTTIDGLVLDVIEYQKRRNKLDDLVARVKELRPDFDWGS